MFHSFVHQRGLLLHRISFGWIRETSLIKSIFHAGLCYHLSIIGGELPVMLSQRLVDLEWALSFIGWDNMPPQNVYMIAAAWKLDYANHCMKLWKVSVFALGSKLWRSLHNLVKLTADYVTVCISSLLASLILERSRLALITSKGP